MLHLPPKDQAHKATQSSNFVHPLAPGLQPYDMLDVNKSSLLPDRIYDQGLIPNECHVFWLKADILERAEKTANDDVSTRIDHMGFAGRNWHTDFLAWSHHGFFFSVDIDPRQLACFIRGLYAPVGAPVAGNHRFGWTLSASAESDNH